MTPTLIVMVVNHPGGSWCGEFLGTDSHANGATMYRVGCHDGTYNAIFEDEVGRIITVEDYSRMIK